MIPVPTAPIFHHASLLRAGLRRVRRAVLWAFASPSIAVAVLRAEQAEEEARELAKRVEALKQLADHRKRELDAALDREQQLLEERRVAERLADRHAEDTLDSMTEAEKGRHNA